ncbi:winged helix DNA-binding domain-containing protein [Halegenticoccus tardaugens]|uniref:winged helix DNA-binding domain-containing protein n=1 Tax=Halegenticoccus tardaugens TaxID=2071624 RepID=UPI00100C33DA|nr:winged helix DNA-binding domain-containing protein [Halegenticoccus tardaugens]
MVTGLSGEQARLFRLRAQSLVNDDNPAAAIPTVIHDCGGVQAQDARQAPLAIRARSREVTVADVEAARIEDRSVIRTWCMRGTLHYLTTEDVSWLLPLFGPLYVDRGQRRLTQLGLNEDDCERAMAVVRSALADHGPLTRGEIAERLLAEGFAFDPDGQAPIHVVRRACLEGIAIEVGAADDRERYGLLDEWLSLDPAPEQIDALAELARWYVAAYEPATLDDFYAWSGLYKRDVRSGWEAIEDELTEVDIAGERAWTLSAPATVEPDDTPIVRLLPMYDSYFLGHEDRELVVPDEYIDRVYPGGGVIRATVTVDGLAAGTWTLDQTRPVATVVVEPFEPLAEAVETGIEAEVEDIGRFLGRDVEYRITKLT